MVHGFVFFTCMLCVPLAGKKQEWNGATHELFIANEITVLEQLGETSSDDLLWPSNVTAARRAFVAVRWRAVRRVQWILLVMQAVFKQHRIQFGGPSGVDDEMATRPVPREVAMIGMHVT